MSEPQGGPSDWFRSHQNELLTNKYFFRETLVKREMSEWRQRDGGLEKQKWKLEKNEIAEIKGLFLVTSPKPLSSSDQKATATQSPWSNSMHEYTTFNAGFYRQLVMVWSKTLLQFIKCFIDLQTKRQKKPPNHWAWLTYKSSVLTKNAIFKMSLIALKLSTKIIHWSKLRQSVKYKIRTYPPKKIFI